MRIRKIWIAINVILALTLAAALVAQQESLFGTWKLNLAKSKYSPGPAPKSTTIKYESWDGGLKATTDTVTDKGEARHNEVTAKFDGKDNPVKGNPDADTQAYTKIDARTYEAVQKKAGKTTITSRIVVAADGKTRSTTQTGKDVKGQTVKNSLFWEKQ